MLEGKYPRTRPLRRGDWFAARWQCDWHCHFDGGDHQQALPAIASMVPKAARVAFIWNAPAKKQLESADVAARKLGVRLLSFEVNTADALPDAFDAAAKGSADR